MDIGEKIKELRLDANLTQQQVANEIGISRSTLSQYENCLIEPTANVIAKLSKFFHVSSDYILNLEDDFGHKVYDDLQNALTDDERKILNAYRILTPSNRDMVLRMLNIDKE